MKVQTLDKKPVDIYNCFVEAYRSGKVICYFVMGEHSRFPLSYGMAPLAAFDDVEEALDYADELKQQIAAEVLPGVTVS